MAERNSDIIEVKLFDASYQLLVKSKARVKDKKQMEKLREELRYKGIKLFETGWFD